MAKREVTSVRIPAEQLVVIRGAALSEGKSLSEYIRDAALDAALEPQPERSEA